jgi:alpha-1,6-mannosyltransferase
VSGRCHNWLPTHLWFHAGSPVRNRGVDGRVARCLNLVIVRIVRLANFVTPRSGGLRTALLQLGEGYQAHGHEAVLVVPGERPDDERTAGGRVITLPGWRVPGTGGYRVLLSRRRLRHLLVELAPDRLEVSDRSTLRWTGRWARRRSIPSLMVSHESLHGLLGATSRSAPLRRLLADYANARTAKTYDTVVCATNWAGADFRRIGATNLAYVPLGVDLETFHPRRHDDVVRCRFAAPHQLLLVHCGRLSVEKRPSRAVEALAALRAAGIDAVLVMVGGGPLRDRLRQQSVGLPVHFVDFITDRGSLAEILATADVTLAPGPTETFGLAALESLACGTPVVVDQASALPEVIGEAGVAVPGSGPAFARGVLELLARGEATRRREARRRAERFGWSRSVAGFLATHGVPIQDAVAPASP